MSELNTNPPQPEKLTPEQEAAYRADLQVMLDPDSIVADSHEEVRAIKEGALADLADGLADDQVNQALSDLMIEDHEGSAKDRSSVSSLYAYWLMIKTAAREHPGAALPDAVVGLTQKLAEQHDETDIALGLISMNLRTKDADGTEIKGAEEGVAPSYADFDSRLGGHTAHLIHQLGELTNEASEGLSRLSSEAKGALNNETGHEHTHDTGLLDAEANHPQNLLDDIRQRKFLTAEGRAAAEARQDAARLDAEANHPQNLLADLRQGNFVTPEGRAAAEARQDAARLDAEANHPQNLLADLRQGNFVTPEGRAAAEARQDAARLDAEANHPQNLLADLRQGNFVTPEGKAEAHRIIGIASEH